jgi:hypothetical protein
MKRPELAAAAPLVLALVLAACGSASGLDDLFTSQSAGAGGATATTTGHGGASSATAGGTGGTIAATSVAATTGPDTTSGPTTTGPNATGPGATGPGATGPGGPASSSSGGPGNTVFCNNAPCAAGEICCFNLKQPTDHCGQAGTCGDGFIELECNGPEDCPGGVCCADVDFQNNPPYQGIACKQSCNNPQHNLIVCSDANPTCPNGTQCQKSQLLGTGYKICK